MEEESSTDKQETNSKPWLFQPGKSGNPAGRPPGKSLKEYSRAYLAGMTDEERNNFLKGLPKDIIWKMAEGNPKQDVEGDLTINGPGIIKLAE